jgi:hypothetical protein
MHSNGNPFEGLGSRERVEKLADQLREIRPLVHAEELHKKLTGVLTKAGLPEAQVAVTLNHLLRCFIHGWEPPNMANTILLAAEEYGLKRDELVAAALKAGMLKNGAGERGMTQLKKNMRDRLSAARGQAKASPAPISPTQLADALLRADELKERFKAELSPGEPLNMNRLVAERGEPDKHRMKEISDRVEELLNSEDRGGTECQFAVVFAMVRWLDACEISRGEQVQLVRYVQESLPDFKGDQRS